MGPYHRAVDNDIFHIGVLGKMVMHPFPDAFITPAGKPLVDAVPVAVAFGQQSPLGAATGDPENPFHKPAAVRFLAHIHVRAGTQELKDFPPLVIR